LKHQNYRMKKIMLLALVSVLRFSAEAQSIPQKLELAFNQLQADSQLTHAMASIVVIETQTGKTVWQKNADIGLAPASTQKIFTSIAAFDLLGKDFRYKTQVYYSGILNNGTLNGNVYVLGSGDPTLGSERWQPKYDEVVLKKIVAALQQKGIKTINGEIICGNNNFSEQGIPNGWIWEDIGNYYGAGAYSLNWRENQYDIFASSSTQLNEKATLEAYSKGHFTAQLINELKTEKLGSGDNAYIYFSVDEQAHPLLKGTIPVQSKGLKITGAYSNPSRIFVSMLGGFLSYGNIQLDTPPVANLVSSAPVIEYRVPVVKNDQLLLTIQSVPLDSINYFFLKKSINLFGEAFIKTLAYEKQGYGSTENGVALLKDFWQQHGIEKSALQISDGSGLSPQNRVTANSLVKALQYAKTCAWFTSFYHALPEYNGMKIKSGSIGGVRAYAGYHKATNGKEYTLAMMVNNYDGSAPAVVKKMFAVLDVLK
jgi:serine-type D-Ala-D-Ala carboxypeptidase/endopeptidase (penicillin-binding protein 4)